MINREKFIRTGLFLASFFLLMATLVLIAQVWSTPCEPVLVSKETHSNVVDIVEECTYYGGESVCNHTTTEVKRDIVWD